MLGVVFTEFVEMLETQHSAALADDVLDDSETSTDGVFTAVGHYPASDMVALVTTLAEKTDTPVPDLLEAFGSYLFDGLAQRLGSIDSRYPDLFDLLAHIHSHIHTEVQRLYPNAELPDFMEEERSDTHMVLLYSSVRRLEYLAKGLIIGAARHYGCTVDISLTEVGPTLVRIAVHRQPAPTP